MALSNTQHRTPGCPELGPSMLGQPVGWLEQRQNGGLGFCPVFWLRGFGKPKRSGEVWSHLCLYLEVLEGWLFFKKKSSSRGAP